MGQEESRPRIETKLKPHREVTLNIPYKQLEIIRALQSEFQYEVKGAFNFDYNYQFKSFEIRTSKSEIYSMGSLDWKITFHTHPDQTAQKFGMRYYSPPSVDDVMEIYELSQHYLTSNISQSLGEVSVVVCNEGIYVMQVDRNLFKNSSVNNMNEDEQEEFLQFQYNRHITEYLKDGIRKIYQEQGRDSANIDFTAPEISYQEFTGILKSLTQSVSEKFGFMMSFYSWPEVERDGLELKTSTYFIETRMPAESDSEDGSF